MSIRALLPSHPPMGRFGEPGMSQCTRGEGLTPLGGARSAAKLLSYKRKADPKPELTSAEFFRTGGEDALTRQGGEGYGRIRPIPHISLEAHGRIRVRAFGNRRSAG